MNYVRRRFQKHATECGNGCGAIVESPWKFCPYCGREKHKGDRHAPPLASGIADAPAAPQKFWKIVECPNFNWQAWKCDAHGEFLDGMPIAAPQPTRELAESNGRESLLPKWQPTSGERRTNDGH